MERIINYKSLSRFASSNDADAKKPIRGIVVNFMWLNFSKMIPDGGDAARRLADNGIIYITPYTNPWAWMNKQTVAYVDDCIDALIEEYGLAENVPIVTTGSSMGGQQALVYMAYAKHTPVACVVNCPVCDLPYHYTEREDLPRTLYSAFGTYDMTMEEALKTASPLHLAEKLPKSDYFIFHGEADKDVNIEKHSRALVKKLSNAHSVTYHTMPDMGHCEMTQEARRLFNDYLLESIEKHSI